MNKVLTFVNKLFGTGEVLTSILDKFIPDKAERLKYENEIRERMFQITKMEFEDMESARQMQIEALKQDDKFAKRFVYYLSILILLNSILAGALAFFYEFPAMNRDFVIQYYTFSFMTGSAQVISFFFGLKSPNSNNSKQ
ncbi:MAG: hypothetical protein CMP76_12270 [Flavobacterium sp.]|uniref:hypothetical protein n=1 Tax=Flavobacterium sp. TaxID=239 RepID=UPI000C5E881A|nr:hypothetical protein [Flavobacterium sp.]MBF04061.1 hypothetical protein [Flavobacterium sp.]|tara:strand:+ start:2028 stop:2447 length:420 start_codon:yes stop_codon:yes gene_type:complete